MRKKGIEKGLGLLTQEIKNSIEKLKNLEKSDEIEIDSSKQQELKVAVSLYPTLKNPTMDMTLFSKNDIDSIRLIIKMKRAKIKASNCRYAHEGFCQYWIYKKSVDIENTFYKKFASDEYALSVSSDTQNSNEDEGYLLRVSDLLCLDCDKYRPRWNSMRICAYG